MGEAVMRLGPIPAGHSKVGPGPYAANGIRQSGSRALGFGLAEETMHPGTNINALYPDADL